MSALAVRQRQQLARRRHACDAVEVEPSQHSEGAAASKEREVAAGLAQQVDLRSTVQWSVLMDQGMLR